MLRRQSSEKIATSLPKNPSIISSLNLYSPNRAQPSSINAKKVEINTHHTSGFDLVALEEERALSIGGLIFNMLTHFEYKDENKFALALKICNSSTTHLESMIFFDKGAIRGMQLAYDVNTGNTLAEIRGNSTIESPKGMKLMLAIEALFEAAQFGSGRACQSLIEANELGIITLSTKDIRALVETQLYWYEASLQPGALAEFKAAQCAPILVVNPKALEAIQETPKESYKKLLDFVDRLLPLTAARATQRSQHVLARNEALLALFELRHFVFDLNIRKVYAYRPAVSALEASHKEADKRAHISIEDERKKSTAQKANAEKTTLEQIGDIEKIDKEENARSEIVKYDRRGIERHVTSSQLETTGDEIKSDLSDATTKLNAEKRKSKLNQKMVDKLTADETEYKARLARYNQQRQTYEASKAQRDQETKQLQSNMRDIHRGIDEAFELFKTNQEQEIDNRAEQLKNLKAQEHQLIDTLVKINPITECIRLAFLVLAQDLSIEFDWLAKIELAFTEDVEKYEKGIFAYEVKEAKMMGSKKIKESLPLLIAANATAYTTLLDLFLSNSKKFIESIKYKLYSREHVVKVNDEHRKKLLQRFTVTGKDDNKNESSIKKALAYYTVTGHQDPLLSLLNSEAELRDLLAPSLQIAHRRESLASMSGDVAGLKEKLLHQSSMDEDLMLALVSPGTAAMSPSPDSENSSLSLSDSKESAEVTPSSKSVIVESADTPTFGNSLQVEFDSMSSPHAQQFTPPPPPPVLSSILMSLAATKTDDVSAVESDMPLPEESKKPAAPPPLPLSPPPPPPPPPPVLTSSAARFFPTIHEAPPEVVSGTTLQQENKKPAAPPPPTSPPPSIIPAVALSLTVTVEEMESDVVLEEKDVHVSLAENTTPPSKDERRLPALPFLGEMIRPQQLKSSVSGENQSKPAPTDAQTHSPAVASGGSLSFNEELLRRRLSLTGKNPGEASSDGSSSENDWNPSDDEHSSETVRSSPGL
jgi:hypothetical protein